MFQVLSVPILMLWSVKLPLRKKLFLMAIFSVTVFVMIVAIVRVAIVRVAVVNSDKHNHDISWLYLWSCVEMTTSVIIACVASFRQFFVAASKQRREQKPGASISRKDWLYWLQLRRKKADSSDALENKLVGDGKMDKPNGIVPLDSVHVGYNISVSASNFKMDGHEDAV
ncbi:MAG: hypothetical protein Q9213_007250 [Squamulea squamosa]